MGEDDRAFSTCRSLGLAGPCTQWVLQAAAEMKETLLGAPSIVARSLPAGDGQMHTPHLAQVHARKE